MKLLFNAHHLCPVCERKISSTRCIGITTTADNVPVAYLLCDKCGAQAQNGLTQEQLHAIEKKIKQSLQGGLKMQEGH